MLASCWEPNLALAVSLNSRCSIYHNDVEFFVVVERVRNKSTDNKSGIRLVFEPNIF